jgi:hypothetical protein
MKKQRKFYLGMDVSKLWIDITLMSVMDHHKQPLISERFDNTEEGLKLMGKWLKDTR